MIKAKKTAAVFTICRNEAIFLPIWLDYYRKHFAEQDVYVLDHQSTDGSTENIKNRFVVNNELTQDNDWLIKVTCDFQQALLRKYRYVLFTNADEIVVPYPPKYKSLLDYIKKKDEEAVRCRGFEVLHLAEPPYDPKRKILEQRHFWYANPLVYNKPLLARVHLEWTGGWHNTRNLNPQVDPDLYLIHLHRMDFSLCLARHKKTSSEPIYRPDLDEKKWGWHHIVHEDEEFAKWFYNVEAAKILNASQSLQIYNKAKKRPLKEIYEKAIESVEKIPPELAVI